MTISLQELTARSEICFCRPDLIEIARNAKSPTAAFDMARQLVRRFNLPRDLARGCRYLAIIKRDYEEVFEQVVKDNRLKTELAFSLDTLMPFIQVANRLHYLFLALPCTNNSESNLLFLPQDRYYAQIVQAMLDDLESMAIPTMNLIITDNNRISLSKANAWLLTARNFLYSVNNGHLVSKDALEGVSWLLRSYIKSLVEKRGLSAVMPNHLLRTILFDQVYDFCLQHSAAPDSPVDPQ